MQLVFTSDVNVSFKDVRRRSNLLIGVLYSNNKSYQREKKANEFAPLVYLC